MKWMLAEGLNFLRAKAMSYAAPAGYTIRSHHFDAVFGDWPSSRAPNPFDTAEWLDSAEFYFRNTKEAAEQGRLAVDHYIVPVCMLAAISMAQRGQVRILDFGGGIGVNYINIAASLPTHATLQYQIVDSPANYERWRRHFQPSDAARYASMIPNVFYDVGFASSTLQYIRDWKAALGAMADVCEQWVVLPRLPITTGTSFVAQQRIEFPIGPWAGKSAGTTSHWFFNRDELIGFLAQRGFALVHDHFISNYGDHLAHLERPAGDVTLRVMSFGRRSGASVSTHSQPTGAA